MTAPGYDPVKAHEYYMRTRHLKGRHKGKAATEKTLERVGGAKRATGSPGKAAKPMSAKERQAASRARVVRLTKKLHTLQNALKEATEALRKKRQADQKSRESAKKTAKKNSDGKSTAKEKAAAKKYRETHKAEIASKAKKSGSSGGSSSKGASSKSVSEMSTTELTDRITKLKSAISSARQQIKAANSMSHSEFIDDTNYLVHDGIERPLTLN